MSDIFARSSFNPILRPQDSHWWKLYNPGAILDEKGTVHLFPRVMKKEKDWHSRIAHATSADGEHFKWSPAPVLKRQSQKEKRGLEDPRITRIGNKYYMVFAVYDGKQPVLHTATAEKLPGPWQRNGPALPGFDFFTSGGRIVELEKGKAVEKTSIKGVHHWSKSGALFPKQFDGKYFLLFGEYYIWFAASEDGKTFTAEQKPFIGPRKGTHYFDNMFIETGPPPILTKKGWLILYHGIDETFRYQLGFIIADKNNPQRILYRSEEPIFSPKEEYEIGDALIDIIEGGVDAMSKLSNKELKDFYRKVRQKSIMPQVIFCPGAVLKNNTLWLYYGAGDTSVCTARAPLDKILAKAGLFV